VYPETGILTAIEFLGFEREAEITLAYMYMIQFIHEHKIENLNGLPKPIFKGSDQHLILSHNCIYQLYLVENKEHSGERYNSLMSILNQCSTSIGRRLFNDKHDNIHIQGGHFP
jgi:DNA mismatch repair ATPase MutS